jgi:hypothetical protein
VTDPLAHVWWLAGRSAGIVAWLALSAAVVLGLLLVTGLAPGRAREMLGLARDRLGVLALGLLAAHGVLLLGEPRVSPGLGLVVPFASGHDPLWTGLGTLAGILLAVAAIARARQVVPVGWLLAAVHVIGGGTDAGSLWLQVPFYVTLVYGLALLGWWAATTVREPPPEPVPPEPAAPEPALAPAPLWLRGEGGR